ncbi:ATP-binding protein [Photobacterium sp. TY1-4]|uniref:ATP-binding protein n=1 Tax=Photobacterium sp. TY1-4 TaxID=2899122 RepID=UPI0021BFAFD8|nr:ATP-binding protein [Photobacterium sp. TY1-4]UXI03931.1 ATP-binding protein [Photobacterium sp. TY1-4]
MLNKLITRRLPSLRSRLLLAAAVWLITITLAAGYLVPNFIKRYLIDQEQQQLALYVDELTARVEFGADGRVSLPEKLSNPRFRSPYSGLYWTIQVNGQQFRSRSLWDARIAGNEENGYTGPKQQSLLLVQRTILLPESDAPVTLMVASDQAKLNATLQQLTQGLWLILLTMAAGILVLIWLQISWSLLPLRTLRQNLKHVRDGEARDLTGTYPIEVKPVIDDLNALLFHYQELLERARNHAGNLSHALKTPIAILTNEVANLTPADQQQLTPALTQLRQHIDYHLGRARMAGAANVLAARSAPAVRVDAIAMAMDKVYAERAVTLVNELDSELVVAVETRDLDEMVGNLIENSYKWASHLIRVHQTAGNAHTVSITIEDDGPGMDDEDYHTVLQRGIRLDETTPGSGLGLSIVNELAHSYRGSLTLDRSALGGIKAVLVLPRPRTES